MTALDYINEVKMRLNAIDLANSISDPFILTQINRARREVQKMSMDMNPVHYSAKTDLILSPVENSDWITIYNDYDGAEVPIITATLPSEVLSVINVYVRWLEAASGVTYRSQCRLSTSIELSNIAATRYSRGTFNSPIYATDSESGTYLLYLAGLFGSTTDVFQKADGDVIAEVWYIQAIKDLENYNIARTADVEQTIPTELEELVILKTIMNISQHFNPKFVADSIQGEINLLMSSYATLANLEKINETILLPSKEGL